jgi:putative ABC transport system permease protein
MFRLARRNLFQNMTQFLMGVGGVTLALLLMLSLDALLAGSEEDLVAYIEGAGADIFVAQDGVKNMHMASSAITRRDLSRAARAEGIASASPILYTTSIIEIGDADVLSYIIGYDPRMPLGGPRSVVAGSAIVHYDEAIIDQAVARTQGIWLGDEVDIFGETFTVVGITRGLTNIANSISFIHYRDFEALRPGNALSYGLLEVAPGYDAEAVARAITAADEDVNALTRADFSREERQIVSDMSVEILTIMNLSGFLIGLAVTALTLYTATLNKRREYGVLKAIGARNRQLYGVVIAQAFLSLGFGFAVAVGLVELLSVILPGLVPGVGVALTLEGVTRVLVSSLVIGTISALAPAIQVARLDPARVFRG